MAHETSGYPTFQNSSHNTHSNQHFQAANINSSGSSAVQPNLAEPRLIDDLFTEVENLLGQRIPPQAWSEKVQTQIPTILPITPTSQSSELTVRADLSNLSGWPTKYESSDQALLLVSEQKKSDSCNSLSHISRSPKIAIVILCSSIATISAIWLTYRGISSAINTSQPVTGTKLQSENTQITQNQNFANYVQRALAAIDRQPETTKFPVSNQPTLNYFKSLSSSPANLSKSPLQARKTTTADKSNTSFSKTPIIINVPAIQTASTSDGHRQELKQVLTRLSNVLEKLDRSTISQNLALRSTQQPKPIATLNKQDQVREPELQRTLKGIVIANDNTQSAVLFEINGVTQRYYTGESMGSSGWKVADISGNYVSLQRNGEVRSLSIGQKI